MSSKKCKEIIAFLLGKTFPKVDLYYIPRVVAVEKKDITYIDEEAENYFKNILPLQNRTKPAAKVVTMNGFPGGDYGQVEAW